MRDLTELNGYRVAIPAECNIYHTGQSGAFLLPNPHSNYPLRVIASVGSGWEHVSVSLEHRCPTWEEMEYIKQRFFREKEWCVQYHPAKEDYVNNHPFCLHIWRPVNKTIPRPPKCLV